MPTLNIYLRFALIGIFLIGGIILSFFTSFWYALPLILIGLVLLLGYFLLGTVQSSALLMQSGQLDKAEKQLELTKKPTWLFGPNKVMYFMVKGAIAMQRKDIKEGEKWLLKADSIETKMPSENESAMIKVQLAALNANRRKWNVAGAYIKEAKKLKVTNFEIKAQMEQIEQMVKTKGMSHAQRVKPKGRKGFRYHK